MRNTLALLALFGLFTTGSAAATTCLDTGSTDNRFCVNDNVVGQCPVNTASCIALVEPCKDLDKHAPCGGTSQTVVGYCSVAGTGGVCHTSKFVKVAYTVRTPKTEGGIEIGEELQEPAFNMQLAEHLDRPAEDHTRKCTKVEDQAITNGKISCPEDPTGSCTVTCTNATFGILKPNNYTCPGSEWEGTTIGECALRCPRVDVTSGALTGESNDEGTLSQGNQVTTFTKKVDHGHVICTGDQAVEAGGSCSLRCGDDRRAPLAKMDYKCTRDNGRTPKLDWTGTLSACEDAYVVTATVKVALKDNEELGDVKESKEFKDKFKKAVAENFSTVGAHHVRISDISAANRRRLFELNNVDGTHSPEDDGGLPVGGGLRGIR